MRLPVLIDWLFGIVFHVRRFRQVLGGVVLLAIIIISATGKADLLTAACVGVFILLGVKSISVR